MLLPASRVKTSPTEDPEIGKGATGIIEAGGARDEKNSLTAIRTTDNIAAHRSAIGVTGSLDVTTGVTAAVCRVWSESFTNRHS